MKKCLSQFAICALFFASASETSSMNAQQIGEIQNKIKNSLKEPISEGNELKSHAMNHLEERDHLKKIGTNLDFDFFQTSQQMDNISRKSAELKCEKDELSKDNCRQESAMASIKKACQTCSAKINETITDKNNLQNEKDRLQSLLFYSSASDSIRVLDNGNVVRLASADRVCIGDGERIETYNTFVPGSIANYANTCYVQILVNQKKIEKAFGWLDKEFINTVHNVLNKKFSRVWADIKEDEISMIFEVKGKDKKIYFYEASVNNSGELNIEPEVKQSNIFFIKFQKVLLFDHPKYKLTTVTPLQKNDAVNKTLASVPKDKKFNGTLDFSNLTRFFNDYYPAHRIELDDCFLGDLFISARKHFDVIFQNQACNYQNFKKITDEQYMIALEDLGRWVKPSVVTTGLRRIYVGDIPLQDNFCNWVWVIENLWKDISPATRVAFLMQDSERAFISISGKSYDLCFKNILQCIQISRNNKNEPIIRLSILLSSDFLMSKLADDRNLETGCCRLNTNINLHPKFLENHSYVENIQMSNKITVVNETDNFSQYSFVKDFEEAWNDKQQRKWIIENFKKYATENNCKNAQCYAECIEYLPPAYVLKNTIIAYLNALPLVVGGNYIDLQLLKKEKQLACLKSLLEAKQAALSLADKSAATKSAQQGTRLGEIKTELNGLHEDIVEINTNLNAIQESLQEPFVTQWNFLINNKRFDVFPARSDIGTVVLNGGEGDADTLLSKVCNVQYLRPDYSYVNRYHFDVKFPAPFTVFHYNYFGNNFTYQDRSLRIVIEILSDGTVKLKSTHPRPGTNSLRLDKLIEKGKEVEKRIKEAQKNGKVGK